MTHDTMLTYEQITKRLTEIAIIFADKTLELEPEEYASLVVEQGELETALNDIWAQMQDQGIEDKEYPTDYRY